MWANFQRIIEFFTQKIVTKLSKIWIWDPGSEKTYSGSRIQGSKRHRIPDPVRNTETNQGFSLTANFYHEDNFLEICKPLHCNPSAKCIKP